MTPQFYSRYIPPPENVNVEQTVDDLEDPRAAKKRKTQIRTASNETVGPGTGKSNITKQKSKHKSVRSELPLAAVAQNPNLTNEAKIPSHGSRGLIDEADENTSSKKGTTPSFDSQGKMSHCVGDENQVQASEKKSKEKKKKKKKKHSRDVGVITDESLPSERSLAAAQSQDQKKHVKLLSKYEKSIASAPKPAEDTSSNNQPDQGAVTSGNVHGLLPLPQPAQTPDLPPPSALSALPSWMINPIEASPVGSLSFDKLTMDPTTTASLKSKGFDEVFAVQAAVLELLLPGPKQHRGDVCIAASTGSGKTLAYALPMIEALRNKAGRRLRGLVIVPTRELVKQAFETLELCVHGSKMKIGTAFGAKSLKEEQEALISHDLRYDPDAYRRQQKREMDEDELLLNWDEDQIGFSSSMEEPLVGYVHESISNVDILVCTPGRLMEHLEHTRGFTLDHVQWLVIDEADRLLEDGFQQWVGTVIPALERQDHPTAEESRIMQEFHLLRKREVRKVILSATMTRDVSKLKDLNLRRPKLVMLQGDLLGSKQGSEELDGAAAASAGGEISLPSSLHEVAIQIKDEENKPLYLIEVINKATALSAPGSKGKAHNVAHVTPQDGHNSDEMDTDGSSVQDSLSGTTSSSESSSSDSDLDSDADNSLKDHQTHPPNGKLHGLLIFTHSTSSAHRLSRLLSLLAPQQASKMATLTKSSAKSSDRVLSRFRDGKLNVIITTDRASRGLDIQNLALVVNYDMPSSIDNYIHRVGRTARAGKMGTAVTLVGWKEGRWFWNEIGRGQRIQRGNKKIARENVREEGWTEEEKERYSDALGKLGEETRAEGKGST
ncbi:MAG: hypothetical protein Q9169_001395 [Polycauliona sp. 2 TL-2023]